MALIKCPECKREVSDQAASCPGCAFPINKQQYTSASVQKSLPQDYLASGESFLDLEEWQRAEEMFLQALASAPADWRVWFGLCKAVSENFTIKNIFVGRVLTGPMMPHAPRAYAGHAAEAAYQVAMSNFRQATARWAEYEEERKRDIERVGLFVKYLSKAFSVADEEAKNKMRQTLKNSEYAADKYEKIVNKAVESAVEYKTGDKDFYAGLFKSYLEIVETSADREERVRQKEEKAKLAEEQRRKQAVIAEEKAEQKKRELKFRIEGYLEQMKKASSRDEIAGILVKWARAVVPGKYGNLDYSTYGSEWDKWSKKDCKDTIKSLKLNQFNSWLMLHKIKDFNFAQSFVKAVKKKALIEQIMELVNTDVLMTKAERRKAKKSENKIKEERQKQAVRKKRAIKKLVALSTVLVVMVSVGLTLFLTLRPRFVFEAVDGGYAVVGRQGISRSEVVIPERHNGRPVTTIGYRAFDSENREIIAVIIPSSVTTIESRAFFGNGRIESIAIPDSVLYIGRYAFFLTTGIESITIPDSVLYIGFDAFAGWRNSQTIYVQTHTSAPSGWPASLARTNARIVWGVD
ncbi:MAG: leucine-rich repeat protein [Firmicutes bacterium]|nr:leucine-rich repeat protein [Bacillota bacterium]